MEISIQPSTTPSAVTPPSKEEANNLSRSIKKAKTNGLEKNLGRATREDENGHFEERLKSSYRDKVRVLYSDIVMGRWPRSKRECIIWWWTWGGRRSMVLYGHDKRREKWSEQTVAFKSNHQACWVYYWLPIPHASTTINVEEPTQFHADWFEQWLLHCSLYKQTRLWSSVTQWPTGYLWPVSSCTTTGSKLYADDNKDWISIGVGDISNTPSQILHKELDREGR